MEGDEIVLNSLSDAYKIYCADIQSGYAIFKERTKQHPLMFLWFFILFITAMWMIAAIISMMVSQPETAIIDLNPKWAYFGLYFMFFTLGGIGTHFRMMRNTDITLVLASPIRHGSVMLGKFMTTFWLNMGMYALGLSTMLCIIRAWSMVQFINLNLYVELTLLVVLGTFAGCLISILGSLRPFARKAFYLWLGSFFLTGVWYGLDIPYIPKISFFTFLIILCAVQLSLSSVFLLEGWNSQTTARSVFGTGGAKYILAFMKKLPLSETTRIIATKEFLFNSRTRENLGSALTIFGLIAAEIAVVQTLGPRSELEMENAYLVYPIVNAMALYIGAILFCTVEGMTLLGKEAKCIWAIKTMPVSGKDVMTGKAFSALLASFILLVAAVPIPLLIYGNWFIVTFSMLGTLALIFTYTGIGIWIGAIAPNFTASFRGTPDVITLYSTMMLCLVLGAVLLFPALVLFRADFILGLLACGIAVTISLGILALGITMAGKAYDRLEVNL